MYYGESEERVVTILDTIAEKTKERIQEEKKSLSLARLKEIIKEKQVLEQEQAGNEHVAEKFRFAEYLGRPGMSFICEVKKASPSKGVIANDFPYLRIAKEYEAAGASAISVLTEPFYFQGSDAYFREIRNVIKIPMLRKDFTVEEYMIYQAKEMGADAILLICSLLSEMQLSEYLGIAAELGLSALVETHDEQEIEMALSVGAGIIGVNNRNLKDFTVDIQNSVRLRKLVPAEKLFVSESGMKTREDIQRLEEANVNAVLIGETLMRSSDKKALLAGLAGKSYAV